MHPTDISSQPSAFKKRGYSATRHARNGNFIHLLIHIKHYINYTLKLYIN
jgi:hypothetical protein